LFIPLLRVLAGVCVLSLPAIATAASIRVCSSGCDFTDLQSAIDAASPGDTILLRAGETFAGNVVLRAKASAGQWITIRSDASDASLPAAGVRLVPEGKPGANTSRSLLPRLVGLGGTLKTTPVVRTAPGASHYRLQFLEIDGTANVGYETLVAIGEHTTAATATDIVLDRVYLHGHPHKGQKRGIALNGVRVDILDSYISDVKAVNTDSQAIAGWNGAGPFRIINNYIEGAAENILFGGVDPAITNLVPGNIEIRRNLITKPLAWRNPILAAPGTPGGSAAGGGSLAAGTHYFRVVAVMSTGAVFAHSPASGERAVTVSAGGSASLSWGAVAGADRYRIYRGTSSGSASRYTETTNTSLVYTGAGEVSGSVPKPTYWVVKNLVELKNARQVLFDGNVIEHIWASGQFGYAIVLTPRNQSGTAPWTQVRDVTFTNNIIRHAAGVIQIVGYDDSASSQQTQRVTLRNNLMYDIDPATWGDYTKAILIGDGPSGVVIDHNTIMHEASSLVYAYGSRQIPGFSFTNNVAPHDDYGIMAAGGRPGTYSLDLYFPSSIVQYNVIQGGSASAYPSPNTFPSLAEWLASFANAGADDYRLLSSSTFYGVGSGGSVPGADLGALEAALGGGGESPTDPPTDPPPSTTNTPPVARPGGPYTSTPGVPFTADGSASSDAEGPLASFTWRWSDDMVLYAADVPASDIAGTGWQRTPMADAAGGVALLNPDRGAGKLTTPLASPASYVDVRFYAAAGVPYRLWMRTRAQYDAWTNDSLFLQFSGRVDADGRAIDRIGTTSASAIVLEEGNGAGVSGWGWNDEQYGGLAGPVYFATSGPQTIRIQQREDGIMWDQIVLSADQYTSGAPGSARSDATILPRTLGTSSAVVASKAYATPGTYPVVLTVQDAGGLVHSAATTATVSTSGGGALTAHAGGPYTGSTGQTVTFDGSGSQASSAAEYSWRFGDEIVLDASQFVIAGSRWQRVSETSTSGGAALVNADWAQPKIGTASASPASYVEARFRAAAGVPYRFWIRMRAESDAWTNDSIFVQFSGAVTSSGAAVHRIGSTGAMGVVLEEGHGAGVYGWGWADGGYGTLGEPIYFNADGQQRIRIQQREDGVRIDQVVISAGAYVASAPGLTKGDTSTVPLFAADSRGAVTEHVYRAPGVFPVELFVIDGGAQATAVTSATIR
jgi:hypothetical protein